MAYNYDEEKEKMRKEILDELNGKKEEKKMEDAPYVSYGMKKKVVNFDIDYDKKDNEQPVVEPPKKSSVIMLVVCSAIALVGILLFPVISDKINKMKIEKENKKIHENKKEEKKPEEVKYEKLTMESAKVKNLVYPVYHVNSESKATYYSKDKMELKNFTNNDLLYNAFINFANIYFEAYKGGYNGKSCASAKVFVSSRYFNIVVKNYMTKDANVKNTDLVIPSYNPNTAYTGIWKYNSSNDSYIYYGDCGKKNASTLYYDLRSMYSVDSTEKNTELYSYNYIGYATVDTKAKQYVIYSDSGYTKKVTSGTLTSNNYQSELNNIFNGLQNKNNFNKYKYTFATKNCPYNEYCFISGEWVK